MSTRPSLGYQPALDGVRAFAVVAVMLYHSGLTWARGGYLGVDVFFALSGFLITGLLLAEWDRWSHLDLLAFWGRRARRLLPALILVILSVATYGRVAAPVGSADSIRGDGLATLFYVGNWRFVVEGQSYFDQYAAPSPLKHTWSLAIEEQFYLIFPLALLLLLGWSGRRWGRLAVALLLGAGFSAWLMATMYVAGTDPSRAYYGTDTRIQTLLVGAALAAVLPWLRRRPRVARPASILGVVGTGVLLFAFLRIDDGNPHMYQGGFLVVAGASTALIAGVVLGGGPVRWLLERRVVVWVGVISYGVYLWHWPVFVWLTPDRTGLNGVALLLLRFLVTFVAAAASYELVERPIRSGSFGRLTNPAKLRAAGAAVLATVVVVLLGTAGLAGSTASASQNARAAATPGRSATYLRAELVGDSVPLGLTSRFDTSAAPGLVVGGSFRLGCGITPEPRVIDGVTLQQPAECPPWSTIWPQEVTQAKPEVVALFVGIYEQFDRVVDGHALRFGTPEYSAYLTRSFDNMRQAVARSGARVALVNAPCRKILDLGTSPDPAIANDPARIAWINSWAASYAADATHATSLIDLHRFVCPNGYQNDLDGVRLRDDGLHFSVAGSSLVWRWLGPQLRLAADQRATGTPTPAATTTSAPTMSAFFLGDSNAFNLRSNYTADVAPDFRLSGSTQLGCGLFPQTLVADGKVIPPQAVCADWIKRRAAELTSAKPDLGVLFAGSWEQYDRVVDGTVLVAGTPEFETDLASRFAGELRTLAATSRHVAIVTDHCHRTPDLGTGPEPHIVNDDNRVAAVNTAVRRAAEEAGVPVRVIDLNTFLCSGGYTATRDGVTLRVDGLHFTPGGARIVWAWLGPQLRAAARD
jgi:peptidoglycan/LPS O-acetylase OafA/YrhL